MSDPRPDLWQTFITKLQGCEWAARDLGLNETAQILNSAQQRAGWERSQLLEKADPANRKRRKGDK